MKFYAGILLIESAPDIPGCRGVVRVQGSLVRDGVVPRPVHEARDLHRSEADHAQGHHGAGVLLVDQPDVFEPSHAARDQGEVRGNVGDQSARFPHR